PVSYASHIGTLAGHFRVITPDTRGGGRTLNPGASAASFTDISEDVVAMIDALGLDRPAIGGFSEGGIAATIVAIRHPGKVRALINDAGYDYLNPKAPSFAMLRQIMGGAPDALESDPAVAEKSFRSSPEM